MEGRTNISNGAGGGIAPGNVTDLKIKTGNTNLTIMWSDPKDTVVEGQVVCLWKGTKVVYKVGGYPLNANDGTLVVDNQERDKYKTNGIQVNNLTNGETYYFALFPYSDKKVYNKNESNRITGSPVAYRTMTVKIDQSNTNPSTCCTYADDAVDMTPGSSDWDDFFGHYPVMLLNGVEGKKLNRNDFTKHEDGSSADITTGAEGDVMIAFPRRGVKISTSGNIVTVSMTDDPNKDGFEYNAHRRNDEQKDVFYLGAYKGYEMSSKLRSLSGKKPTVSKTIGAFRTSAQANGKSNGTSSGYEQSGWFQLIFRQVMYLLKFRNLNSQSAVGNGYTNSGNSASVNTGGTDTYGMDSELIKASNPSYMTDGKHQVKCLGMEDFWGNIYEWIDGMGTDSSGNIMTATTNFNDSRSNYKNSGQGGNSLSGYIKTVQGSTEAGFAIKTSGGSETTCFSDSGSLYSSLFPVFGGYWDHGGVAGAFSLIVSSSASNSDSCLGARLMYL